MVAEGVVRTMTHAVVLHMDHTKMLPVAQTVVLTNSTATVLMVIVIPVISTDVDNVVQRPTLPVTVPRMDRT